jgi:4-hydroxy-tetrahydrodipicolinate synthase
MSSLVMGANGLLSGAGSVIANLQVSLFKAVKNKDLNAAQEINDKIFPLAQAFYTPPFLDMHNRMKEVLVLMGKMERAIVRPPLMKLNVNELNNLKKALKQSGI